MSHIEPTEKKQAKNWQFYLELAGEILLRKTHIRLLSVFANDNQCLY